MDSRYIEESKIRPSGTITYLAARYEHETDAGRAYSELDRLMRSHNLDISVRRVQIREVWHVVFLIDVNHLPLVLDEATQMLTQGGMLATLDQAILNELIKRRKERTQDIDRYSPTRSIVESHIPIPLHVQPKPFIIEYRDARTERFFENATEDARRSLELPTNEGKSLMEAAREVYIACLRRAEKYLFTPSALNMHWAVFQLPARPINNPIWFDVSGNVWIELQEPLPSEQGPIKALYLLRAYPKTELEQVVPARQFPFTSQTLHKIFSFQAKEYTLGIIREDTRVVHNFTYDMGIKAWIYPPASYKCPYNQCARVPVTLPGNEPGTTLIACEQCKQDCWHWTNWLKTALLIVNRHYAVTPEPAEFPTETQEYQIIEQVTVGHGKNKRKIAQQVKRHVEYRLIRYEVGMLEPEHEQAAVSLAEREHKRLNWLQLTDKSAIIWEKRAIDTSKGRLLNPDRNPRWKSYRRIDVKPYQRYVPMLTRERKTIRKVVAKQYEE